MNKRVMILPCSGIGKPAGEIGRQAAYRAAQGLRPENAHIACLARLMIDDQDTVDLVKDNYVITLDGCAEDCAKKNVERVGKVVDYSIHVTDFMEEHPDLHPLGILNLGDDGAKLVDLLALQLASRVDVLSAKEGWK